MYTHRLKRTKHTQRHSIHSHSRVIIEQQQWTKWSERCKCVAHVRLYVRTFLYTCAKATFRYIYYLMFSISMIIFVRGRCCSLVFLCIAQQHTGKQNEYLHVVNINIISCCAELWHSETDRVPYVPYTNCIYIYRSIPKNWEETSRNDVKKLLNQERV